MFYFYFFWSTFSIKTNKETNISSSLAKEVKSPHSELRKQTQIKATEDEVQLRSGLTGNQTHTPEKRPLGNQFSSQPLQHQELYLASAPVTSVRTHRGQCAVSGGEIKTESKRHEERGLLTSALCFLLGGTKASDTAIQTGIAAPPSFCWESQPSRPRFSLRVRLCRLPAEVGVRVRASLCQV